MFEELIEEIHKIDDILSSLLIITQMLMVNEQTKRFWPSDTQLKQ